MTELPIQAGPIAHLQSVYIALMKDRRLWEGELATGFQLVAHLCGNAIGTARCSVWLMDRAVDEINCEVLCERNACYPNPGVRLKRTDHPEYFRCLDNDRVIEVADTHTDIRTLSFTEYFAAFNIGAMLDATLRSEGELIGAICWEHEAGPRIWSLEERNFASSVADLVSQLIVFHRLRSTEERYRKVFNAAGDAMALLCGDRVVDCNEVALKMFRVGRPQLYASQPQRFWAERQANGRLSQLEAKTAFEQAAKSGVQGLEWRHRRSDGAEFDAELGITPIFLEGRLHQIVCIRDVSTRKQTERQIRELNSIQQAIFDGANYAIIATDLSGIIHTFNKAAERFLGYRALEVIGKKSPDIFHSAAEIRKRALELSHELGVRVEPGFEAFVAKARQNMLDESEWTYVRKDGTTFPVLLSVTALRNSDNEIAGFVGIASDISERIRANAELLNSKREIERNANHDALTGLPNRNRLHDVARVAICNAAERHQNLALMLLDLDRFKEVNDTLGHAVGDKLLKMVAQRLQTLLLGFGAYLYRLGGDEFAIMVTRSPSKESTIALAQTIKTILRSPLHIDGITLELGGSIGIAFYPEHGQDSHDLLRCADVAMYKAKQQTAGPTFYEPSMDAHTPRRLTLLAELGIAIRENQLVLHYQPRVDIATGRCLGCEALVRWQHPTLGLIPPNEFIPLAEASDLIQPLGVWVLEKAMAQTREWRDMKLELIMSINLTARNLMEESFPTTIQRVLKEQQIPAACLEVEITESTLISEPERTLAVLNQIHALGVRFAIDDFGTGYSSLSYLKRLPIDTLKIDRSFIRDMLIDEQDAMIVRSTLGLAHGFGLDVVAEGVEDEPTLTALRALDCEQVQGYLISRPLPAKDFLAWLLKYNLDHLF